MSTDRAVARISRTTRQRGVPYSLLHFSFLLSSLSLPFSPPFPFSSVVFRISEGDNPPQLPSHFPAFPSFRPLPIRSRLP